MALDVNGLLLPYLTPVSVLRYRSLAAIACDDLEL